MQQPPVILAPVFNIININAGVRNSWEWRICAMLNDFSLFSGNHMTTPLKGLLDIDKPIDFTAKVGDASLARFVGTLKAEPESSWKPVKWTVSLNGEITLMPTWFKSMQEVVSAVESASFHAEPPQETFLSAPHTRGSDYLRDRLNANRAAKEKKVGEGAGEDSE